MPNSDLPIPSFSKKIEPVVGVVQWEPQALPGGKAEEISARLTCMDEGTNPGRIPGATSNLGIQLRAVVQGVADKPLPDIIDTSRPFSWSASRRDDDGRLVEKGCVPSADAIASIVREYEQYLQSRFEGELSINYSVEAVLFRQLVPVSAKLHNKVYLSDLSAAQSGACATDKESPDSGFGTALNQQRTAVSGLNADRDPSVIKPS